jgi:hypothetical protein
VAPRTLFYCWQSDLPPGVNRNFIRKAIDSALKELATDVACDEDARGSIGLASIPDALLNKIRACDAFVCDISIVNGAARDRNSPQEASGVRLMPNPNVMFELGYAVAVQGWDRTIAVLNAYYGSYEALPFDLGWRTPIAYSLKPEDTAEQRQTVQKALASKLREYISAVLARPKSAPIAPLDWHVAWAMRDALATMRLPFDSFCRRAAEDDDKRATHLVLESAPPDLPGIPPRPDPATLAPVLTALTDKWLLEECDDRWGPAHVRWIDWILNGLQVCAELCQTPLNRHSATADTRLIAGLERLSKNVAEYRLILADILAHHVHDLTGSPGNSFFRLALQEMLHGERVWREVVGAAVDQ